LSVFIEQHIGNGFHLIRQYLSRELIADNSGDAGGEAAARLTRSRLKRRKGSEDSILTRGLGVPGAGAGAGGKVSSTLGGGY
jgi:hypothetical protein